MERFGDALFDAPLALIWLVLIAGMALAAWFGTWWRRRGERSDPDRTGTDTTQEGYIVSAVLGLLALLMGFTFAMAIDRFDTRRERVLLEANAIETAWLRAQLLEAPHRERISGLLADYADARVAMATEPDGEAPEHLAENKRLIDDLWTATVAAFPTIRQYDFSTAFLDSMNGVIELDAARRTARRAHIPVEVLLILFAFQFASAGVLGHVLVGRRGRLSAAMLFVLFSLALILIVDIDRPQVGGITAPQQPMLELRDKLRSTPLELYDRFRATDEE